MFKHYLTTALRHFRQHKLVTLINVVCLTIGLVCFLASYVVVNYFGSSDRHFANADRVYMVTGNLNSARTAAFGSWLTAKYLKTDFPEAKIIARATMSSPMFSDVPIASGNHKDFVHIAYADPEFLNVFSLPFLAGESTTALHSPRSAVISKDTAIRFFGSVSSAIGQSLRLQDGHEITVRGVLDALKQPSHISTTSDLPIGLVRFDVLMSMDVLEAEAIADPFKQALLTNWNLPICFTYLVLPTDGTLNEETLRSRLRHFGNLHANSEGNTFEFGAITVGDYSLSMMGVMLGGNNPHTSAIFMFYFLGAVVLLASCINYANLATAQATARTKEIGMRRVVGARRAQIAAQFMLEATLLTLTALLGALLIIAIALLAIHLPGAGAVATWVTSSPQFWLMLLTLLATVTLFAGSYPAFVLSRIRPVQAVRAGKLQSVGRFAPQMLIGLQFVAASFLLISMLVMLKQNTELQRSILSSSTATFVQVTNDARAAGINYEVLRTELLRQPNVQAVTASGISPWITVAQPLDVAASPEKSARKLPTTQSVVNLDFFPTLGIKLLAGRVFDREHANDVSSFNLDRSARAESIVIDQAFAQELGWNDPKDALGKKIYTFDIASVNGIPIPRTVIGVVENRAMSIMSPFGATSNMYLFDPERANRPVIRVSGENSASALKEIASVWNHLAPTVALRMQFADVVLNSNYQLFNLISGVFGGIAALALIISILGLIGMSIQIIGRRQHEIGIRKTLGASVRNVVGLLLTDFSKPVIVANLVAWPLVFVAMNFYLSLFTQRIGLSPIPFVTGLIVTLLVAWFAVAAQATRAARMNPATVLRND